MELSFLYAIPRTEALDTFFLGLTKLVGSYGQLFLFLGIALLFPRPGSSSFPSTHTAWAFASVSCRSGMRVLS